MKQEGIVEVNGHFSFLGSQKPNETLPEGYTRLLRKIAENKKVTVVIVTLG